MLRYRKLRFPSLFIKVLNSVMSYELQGLFDSSELNLNEPFAVIGHHLEEVEDYLRRTDAAGIGSESEANLVERESHTHVGLVLNFVKTILKDPIAEEHARYSQAVPVGTYRMMWYLIRPGDFVYVMSDEVEDTYVVNSVEVEQFSLSLKDINVVCCLNLWYLEFNGLCIT